MDLQKPTVMVIEDEKLLLQAIAKKLEINGIKYVSCIGGQQAFDYLTNSLQLPDLIWLDYYLRDMNGLEVMEKLKKNPKWANIPVIIVSNSADKNKVSSILALGASKYFLKTEYRLDEIVNAILEMIDKKALQ